MSLPLAGVRPRISTTILLEKLDHTFSVLILLRFYLVQESNQFKQQVAHLPYRSKHILKHTKPLVNTSNMSASSLASAASDRAEAEKNRDESRLDEEKGELDHHETVAYPSGFKLFAICVALVLTVFLVRRNYSSTDNIILSDTNNWTSRLRLIR
jgi:hypothetical protein